MSPLQQEQADVLRELANIDKMDIEVTLAPPSSMRVRRKSKLIPLAFIDQPSMEVVVNKRKSVETRKRASKKKDDVLLVKSEVPIEELELKQEITSSPEQSQETVNVEPEDLTEPPPPPVLKRTWTESPAWTVGMAAASG